MTGTDNLIENLARGLKPARRMASPAVRACVFLALVLVAATSAILVFADFAGFAQRMGQGVRMTEFVATLLTGVVAVIAAFMASVPDRWRGWRFLPLAPLALWLAASGSQCLGALSALGAAGWTHEATPQCFVFIAVIGLPLLLTLLLLLRRARPLEPVTVALLGALGAGALGAAVLSFFHPIDATFLDLGFHLAAVGLLLGIAGVASRVLSGDRVARGSPVARGGGYSSK